MQVYSASFYLDIQANGNYKFLLTQNFTDDYEYCYDDFSYCSNSACSYCSSSERDLNSIDLETGQWSINNNSLSMEADNYKRNFNWFS